MKNNVDINIFNNSRICNVNMEKYSSYEYCPLIQQNLNIESYLHAMHLSFLRNIQTHLFSLLFFLF